MDESIRSKLEEKLDVQIKLIDFGLAGGMDTVYEISFGRFAHRRSHV